MAVSLGDRMRLAIALVALRFKPKDQSETAYVLDLQSRFPLPSSRGVGASPLLSPPKSNSTSASTSGSHFASSQTSSRTTTTRELKAPQSDGDAYGPWKSHALMLEKEIETLRCQYEAEQLRCVTLETALARAETTLVSLSSTPQLSGGDPGNSNNEPRYSSSSNVNGGGKKKQTKKKTLRGTTFKPPDDFNVNSDSVVKSLFEKADLGSFGLESSLVVCLGDLERLLEATTSGASVHAKHRQFVLSAASRVVKAIGVQLHSLYVATSRIPPPDHHRPEWTPTDKVPLPLNSRSLSTLQYILVWVLDSIFPFVFPSETASRVQSRAKSSSSTSPLLIDIHTRINEFLGHVLEDVILPIIRTFNGLSWSAFAMEFELSTDSSSCSEPHSRENLPLDLRPDLFSLVQVVLDKALQQIQRMDHMLNVPQTGRDLNGSTFLARPICLLEPVALEASRQLKSSILSHTAATTNTTPAASSSNTMKPANPSTLQESFPVTPVAANANGQCYPECHKQERRTASNTSTQIEFDATSTTRMMIHRLALKDTIWYLCGVLHHVFSKPEPQLHWRRGGDARLLRAGVINELRDVLSLCRGSSKLPLSGHQDISKEGEEAQEEPQPQKEGFQGHPQQQRQTDDIVGRDADVIPAGGETRGITRMGERMSRRAIKKPISEDWRQHDRGLVLEEEEERGTRGRRDSQAIRGISPNPGVSPPNMDESAGPASVLGRTTTLLHETAWYLEELFKTRLDLPEIEGISEDYDDDVVAEGGMTSTSLNFGTIGGAPSGEVTHDLILGVIERFWIWDSASL